MTGDLDLAGAHRMTLSGGARAKNVAWQVAGFVDLGTTSHAEGVVLAMASIRTETESSINSRLYAQEASSSMQ